jgi:hypothetical protein
MGLGRAVINTSCRPIYQQINEFLASKNFAALSEESPAGAKIERIAADVARGG